MVDKKKKRNKALQPKLTMRMTTNEDQISGTMGPSLNGEDLIHVSPSRVCSFSPPSGVTPCFWTLLRVYDIALLKTSIVPLFLSQWIYRYDFSIREFVHTFPDAGEAYWKRWRKYDGVD